MKHDGKLTQMALGVLLGLGLVAGGTPAVLASDAPAAATRAQADNVTRATLANGLRVVIVRNSLAPMVTTQITYLTGGYETPKGFPGTAHALEHMMFRNSKGMTGAQLNEMTGKMGAVNNAFTTDDGTQYFFAAPAQYLGLLLQIEATRMRGAQLTNTDWDLEKGAIEQEVSRDISDPSYLAFAEARRELYAGTGYANDPLGSRPSFDNTNSKILETFYNRWYQPNNAILVVAGDVDPKSTLAQIEQLFSSIPKGDVPAREPVNLKPFKANTIRKTTPDATGNVQYLFRVPGQQSPDYAAVQVLIDVLNNSRSKLSDLAAQGKVLSAGADTQSFLHGGIGTIQVEFPKDGDSSKAKGYLDVTLADLLRNGVASDLVAAAKRQESAQYEFSKNSTMELATSWSQALAWQGLNSPKQALDQILAVTPAEVDRVARKYIKPDQRLTVVLTPDTKGERPADSQGFGGTESFASDDKLDSPLPAWASKHLTELKMPHWTLNPVTMKLSNGITLIVQSTHVSKTVTVAGRIDSDEGMQAPKGQIGVGKLLDNLFDYGTNDLDRTAFHSALDEIAATESAGGSFTLAVPSDQFDRGMQLLAANELHPAIPATAFKVQQEMRARTTKGQLESPDYKMRRVLFESLYPAGDPGLRQYTPAKINALTLKDVKNYYASVYRPDMTTIVIVGDVTPATAKAEVEKYFGEWKAAGPKPEVVPRPVPLNKGNYVVVPDSYASQDQVTIGQMLDLNVHNPDRYALQLGNEVLGGNGFASRLMVDIRVKHGYAYGAGSDVNFYRSRSLFFVNYASDAAKVKPVNGLVLKNLEEMRNVPVKPSELLNAKQALIRSIPLDVSSVRGIANSLLGWSTNGLPLDEPLVAANHYRNMTARDVQTAFQKYIKPAHLVQVISGPTPKQH